MKWLPIPDLSPEDDARLRQLVEAFLAERQGRAPKRPTLAWWGGAQALRERYTSVALQHQANEWRIQSALDADEISPGH
jgi:hypothetical protein